MQGEKNWFLIISLNILSLIFGLLKALIPFFVDEMAEETQTFQEFKIDAFYLALLIILCSVIKQLRKLIRKNLFYKF